MSLRVYHLISKGSESDDFMGYIWYRHSIFDFVLFSMFYMIMSLGGW